MREENVDSHTHTGSIASALTLIKVNPHDRTFPLK